MKLMYLFSQAIDDDYGFGFLFLIIFSVLMYFVPTIAARNKSQFSPVAILNLFLGWTIVGWVIALAWALEDPQQTVVQQFPVNPFQSPIFCNACGKYSQGGSGFCTTCGARLGMDVRPRINPN